MKPSHRVTPLRALLGRPSHALAFLILLTAAAPAQAAPTLADFGHKNMEAKGKRPLLVILLQDPDLPPLQHDVKYFDKLFFGSDRQTVNGYYTAMSGGRFSWSRAGVIGPFKAKVTDGPNYRARAVQEAAKNGFDFSKFANKDGIVAPTALTICVIVNGGNGGQTDASSNVPIPGKKLTVRSGIAGVGHTASFMTICHENMHTLGSLDIYGWDPGNFNNRLTLMGATIVGADDDMQTYYLDAWHRMQFGWVDPQIRDLHDPVGGSVGLIVQQLVEMPKAKAPSPLILYDSRRGTKEFFILEHRNASLGAKFHYDKDVASNGLAIWHVQHGNDKKPIMMPGEASGNQKIYALYNRGAPDFKQGGNTLYKPGNAEIALRWMDKSDTGVRLKVSLTLFPKPSKEVVRVSWNGPQRSGASLIQSSFGNLEAVAHEGNELWHWYFVPGKAWARGGVITNKATGPGSIVQNKNGNFEVAALEGKNLVHYWTVPGKPYNRGAVITTKASGPGSILFSSVGNLEAVVLEGKELAHYWCDKGKWKRGAVITNKATGPGSIAQNKNGNFEVVVLEGKDLVHYWTVPGKPYNRGAVITNKATGPGSIVQGSPGNLEVIVQEGKDLVHYWEKPGQAWNRGSVITNKTARVGVGAICRNRNKNLEAVMIEGNQIVHFWEVPGKAWNRGASY